MQDGLVGTSDQYLGQQHARPDVKDGVPAEGPPADRPIGKPRDLATETELAIMPAAASITPAMVMVALAGVGDRRPRPRRVLNRHSRSRVPVTRLAIDDGERLI